MQLGLRPVLPNSIPENPNYQVPKFGGTYRLPTQRAVLTDSTIKRSNRGLSHQSDSALKINPTPKVVRFSCPSDTTSPPKVAENTGTNCALSSTSNFYNRQITETFDRLREIFPEEATTEHRTQLWKIAETAYQLADEIYSVKEANIWAANFEITDDIVNNDEALFRASMRDNGSEEKEATFT